MTDPSGLPYLVARVLVFAARLHCECMALRDGSWRCGKCGRGKLEPEIGECCRVCGSVVAKVHLVPDVERIQALRDQESRRLFHMERFNHTA